MSYKQKYLIYKKKYLKLKMIGGKIDEELKQLNAVTQNEKRFEDVPEKYKYIFDDDKKLDLYKYLPVEKIKEEKKDYITKIFLAAVTNNGLALKFISIYLLWFVLQYNCETILSAAVTQNAEAFEHVFRGYYKHIDQINIYQDSLTKDVDQINKQLTKNNKQTKLKAIISELDRRKAIISELIERKKKSDEIINKITQIEKVKKYIEEVIRTNKLYGSDKLPDWRYNINIKYGKKY